MDRLKRQEEAAVVARLTTLLGHGSGSIGALITITAASGSVISATGVSLLILSYLFLRRAQGIRCTRDQRRHYALIDQTPKEKSLLAQLEQADHVVIGHYDRQGKPWRSVIICHDTQMMADLIRNGTGLPLAEVLKVADNEQIFFTAGPL
ncbi:MAG TPA: hypothetical protein VK502_02425 [Candidatus Saccharimonadales bacterium]|nr:hypothetical protein [Candidatus Saccharimonadales bacterium]